MKLLVNVSAANTVCNAATALVSQSATPHAILDLPTQTTAAQVMTRPWLFWLSRRAAPARKRRLRLKLAQRMAHQATLLESKRQPVCRMYAYQEVLQEGTGVLGAQIQPLCDVGCLLQEC